MLNCDLKYFNMNIQIQQQQQKYKKQTNIGNICKYRRREWKLKQNSCCICFTTAITTGVSNVFFFIREAAQQSLILHIILPFCFLQVPPASFPRFLMAHSSSYSSSWNELSM